MAAIAAGSLLLVGELWSLLAMIMVGETGKFSEFAATGSWSAITAMYLIGALLLLVALVGLYARQSEEAGTLGVRCKLYERQTSRKGKAMAKVGYLRLLMVVTAATLAPSEK